MERMDAQLQRRVWERVLGTAEQPRQENWKGLLYPAQENALVYQNLSAQSGQHHGEKLRRLQQEQRRCIACIKGICRLRGEKVKTPVVQIPKEPARRALEKCYHREKRVWEACEHWSSDPDHGVVFGRLAQQAREHCVTILEILGEMEG